MSSSVSPTISRETSNLFTAIKQVVPLELSQHLISKQTLWNMVQFLPICVIIEVLLAGIGVYTWAWGTGNIIGETVPMISHMGTYPPQSCFFTLILSMASFALFMIAVIMHQIILRRYKLQIAKKRCNYGEKPQMLLNDLSLVFGILASLGLCLVGDFQTTDMPGWHKFGLGVFVLFGQLYMYCMLLVAPRGGSPDKDGHWMPDLSYWDIFRVTRLVITILSTIFVILFAVFYAFAYSAWYPGPIGDRKVVNRSTWNPQDGGFYYYRAAACFEITFILLFLLFVATLQRDFYHTTLFDSKITDKEYCDCFERKHNNVTSEDI